MTVGTEHTKISVLHDDGTLFQNCKKVLIIEGRVGSRAILRDVVKELGIKDIIVSHSVEDGWNVLESSDEPPDWIITSLDVVSEVNAFSILTLFVEEPVFKKTRVSLILNPEEQYCLPLAFELGLFSYHPNSFTKTTIKNSFANISERWLQCRKSDTLVAASFLREYLSNNEKFHELIELESLLISKFPGEGEILVKLAEAQYLNGNIQDAHKTLLQAKYLGINIKKAAQQLQELMNSDDSSASSESEEIAFAKAFDIKTCVIVDSDDTSCMLIKEALNDIGVENVVRFHDGEAAFNYLNSNQNVQAIIQEWRLSKLSGAALVQRVRQMFKYYVPIFVVSSLVKANESHLLREIGVSAVIEKPASKEYFLSNFINILREEKHLTNHSALERLIRQSLSQRDLPKAKELFTKYKSMGAPEICQVFEAEIALADNDLNAAKEHAILALKLKGDSVFALNILGKVMLKSGDTDGAIKCFSRAKDHSPQNLERLCLLSEAYADSGDNEHAKKALNEARSIDDKNEKIAEMEIKVALAAGDLSTAKDAMTQMESLSSLVAYINNRAVVLVKQGRAGDGIELYQKAIETLPSKNTAERSIIQYNLGLAYARIGKVDEASKIFGTIDSQGFDSRIKDKAMSLKSRIDVAKASGKKIVLKTNDATSISVKSGAIGNKHDYLCPMAIHAKPGEMRLHLVYNSQSGEDEKCKTLLRPRPKFTSRIQQTLLKDM